MWLKEEDVLTDVIGCRQRPAHLRARTHFQTIELKVTVDHENVVIERR